jgi:F0F1-type ATP synthase membrane subunit a
MSQPGLASANVEVGVHRTVTLFGFAMNIDTIAATAIAGVIVIGLGLALRLSVTTAVPAKVQAQFEAGQRQAVRQLKTDLGNLAVELAEKIVGEALADSQRQRRLIERFLSEIEEEANGRVRRPAN